MLAYKANQTPAPSRPAPIASQAPVVPKVAQQPVTPKPVTAAPLNRPQPVRPSAMSEAVSISTTEAPSFSLSSVGNASPLNFKGRPDTH